MADPGPFAFVDDMQCKIDPNQSLKDIPKPQKNRPIKPLSYYKERFKNRNRAMAEAYRSGHYTLSEIGDEFGVSYATVSRAVKEYELNTEV
jgi:putative transposase